MCWCLHRTSGKSALRSDTVREALEEAGKKPQNSKLCIFNVIWIVWVESTLKLLCPTPAMGTARDGSSVRTLSPDFQEGKIL